MLGNLHVRFGVGAGVKLPGLHHAVGLALYDAADRVTGKGDERG
jgi:hypothetical protein